MPDCLDDAGPVLKGLLSPGQQPIFRHGSIPESSEKTLHPLLIRAFWTFPESSLFDPG